MDNNKTIVVLTPKGRRQTLKTNPNTTILQIIEEVCKKHDLNSNEFDVKHHNKCLDTSTIIRFSGLPNNAQLELIPATKPRTESAVILALQLEDGTRLTGTFTPGNSLWDILYELCPDEANPDLNPVVIYMRREIYGITSLKETNLRSLGITTGRAILRLVHRSPEELGVQANVATPLPSKPVEEKPYIRKLIKLDSPVESSPVQPMNIPSQDTTLLEDPKVLDTQSQRPIQTNPEKKVKKETNFITQFIKQEKSKHHENTKKPIRVVESMEVDTNEPLQHENTVEEEEFIFLGTRNAMIFSQVTAQAIPTEDLPDDFFELTINDAKKILKDMKKARMELENTPLQTAALRDLEQSKRQLSQLNRYKQSILRIHFPDHTVLQGTFSPVDSINTVIEFVKDYLENQQMQFYLYTTPPKSILNGDSRLIEIGCVPNAVLYFGTNTLSKDEVYLRSDLSNKFTTPSIASLAATKIRKKTSRFDPVSQNNEEEDFLEESSMNESDVNAGATTSTGAYSNYENFPAQINKSPEKMPKWFKPTK